MNTFMKTVRVVTDLVILAVMGLELKDQINKMRLERHRELWPLPEPHNRRGTTMNEPFHRQNRADRDCHSGDAACDSA